MSIGKLNDTSLLAAILPACLAKTRTDPYNDGDLFPIYSNHDILQASGVSLNSGFDSNGYIDCTNGIIKLLFNTSLDIPLEDDMTIFMSLRTTVTSGIIRATYNYELPLTSTPQWTYINLITGISILSFAPGTKSGYDNNAAIAFNYNYGRLDVVWKKVGSEQSIYLNGLPLDESRYVINSTTGLLQSPLISPMRIPDDYTLIGGLSVDDNLGDRFYKFIAFHRALSDEEILELHNLGDDLGGLAGADNGDGTMDLYYPATVISSPVDQTVRDGGYSDLEVVADGEGTLSYQWQQKVGDDWVNIRNATERVFRSQFFSKNGGKRV